MSRLVWLGLELPASIAGEIFSWDEVVGGFGAGAVYERLGLQKEESASATTSIEEFLGCGHEVP